jgi:CheY-like chemotaxis protein
MAGSTKTILIIDADTASRNFLAMTLKKSHYEVVLAASGKEGLIMAWQNMPDAIIIDPALPDLPGLDLVTRLRQDRRTSMVPCLALCAHDKPDEKAQLITAGFNEYLVKSQEAVSKILVILPRLLGIEAAAKKGGLLIVFLGAKGGTGTSSLCANLAMCTGKSFSNSSIAVMDMVLPIGSLAGMTGYHDQMSLITLAAQDPAQVTAGYLKENLPRLGPWYFNLLAGSPDPDASNQLQVNRIPDLVTALIEAYDEVFIDLGRSLSRITMPILQRADVIVLVLGSDLAAVNLTKTVLHFLEGQNIHRKRICMIVNRAVGLEGLSKPEIDRELGMDAMITIPYLGGNMTVSNNRHQPFAALSDTDSSAMIFMQVARQIAELAQKLRTQ